jgi:predicted ABC-type exoprotein transport system permease subunit
MFMQAMMDDVFVFGLLTLLAILAQCYGRLLIIKHP